LEHVSHVCNNYFISPLRQWQRGASRPVGSWHGTAAGSGRLTTFNSCQKTVLVEYAMVDGHVEQLVVAVEKTAKAHRFRHERLHELI
jgi:hypothetical protein